MRVYPILAALLLCSAITVAAEPCKPAVVKSAAPSEIKAFFGDRRLQALTFMGYSGAEYEDPAAMLALAGQTLDKYSPQKTLVLIGATREGIGAVYDLAKRKGFTTAGIVSSQAKVNNVPFSSCVDHVFVVGDATWGGLDATTKRLSPTSVAMVESSDVMVAIGGGDVTRDELTAGRDAGKRIEFHAADMNHKDRARTRQEAGGTGAREFRRFGGRNVREAVDCPCPFPFAFAGPALLTDRSVRGSRERVARLVAVARSRGVLDQPDVVGEHVPGHRAGGILVTGVLVVDAQGHAHIDRHVGERDLVAVWRHRLERDAREAAPARMRVSDADAVDTGLRRSRQVGSPGRCADEHETDGCRGRARRSHRRGRAVRLVTTQHAQAECQRERPRAHAYSIPAPGWRNRDDAVRRVTGPIPPPPGS